MRNVVVIEPEWLPIYATKLCSLSKPLEDPAPYYDDKNHQVMCYRSATFGPHQWPVPQTEHPYPDGLEKYKYFAQFLLEGKVVHWFAKYSRSLLSSPATLNKSWAKLQPRTTSFLSALTTASVDNLHALNKLWQTDATFLLKEYKEWVVEELHYEISQNWPPTK
jgi:ATP-dependent RNA helicase DHX37/DHR1